MDHTHTTTTTTTTTTATTTTHSNRGLRWVSQGFRLIALRTNWDADMGQSAAEMAVAVDTARTTLRSWSRVANTRAFFVLNGMMPRVLRDRILVLVGASHRTQNGVCCAEAYEQMIRLRYELMSEEDGGNGGVTHSTQQTIDHLTATLAVFEQRAEIQQCVHSHRVAAAACRTFTSFISHTHGMCPCGGCCYHILTRPPAGH